MKSAPKLSDFWNGNPESYHSAWDDYYRELNRWIDQTHPPSPTEHPLRRGLPPLRRGYTIPERWKGRGEGVITAIFLLMIIKGYIEL